MNNALTSEDKEILMSLERVVDITRDALNKDAIDAAFFCSLSIPDIMGQFCYNDLREQTNKKKNVVGQRYIRWYNEYVYTYENSFLNQKDNDHIFQNINQIDGKILYAIRCKLFHQGSILHDDVIDKIRIKYSELIGDNEKDLKLDISFDSLGTSYGYSTTNYDNLITIKINISKKDMAKTLMIHGTHQLKKYRKAPLLKRPPKVRPKNLTFGGRYLYGKISF